MRPREPPRRLQYHISSITLEALATHTLMLSAKSRMFTLVFSVSRDFHSSCRKDHNTTRAVCCFPQRKICLSCKQTDSCLHWASAALSIYNFVCTSLLGGKRNVWFRRCHVRLMLKFKLTLVQKFEVPNRQQVTGEKNSTLDLSAEKSPPRELNGCKNYVESCIECCVSLLFLY